MILSGKQKRYLRSLAVNLKPVVIIGKDGVSANLIDSIDVALEAHELIKIKVLETFDADLNELASDLAEVSDSYLIQKMGRTILLYRPSEDKKIKL